MWRNKSVVSMFLFMFISMAFASVSFASVPNFSLPHVPYLQPKVFIPQGDIYVAQFTVVNQTGATIRNIYFVGFHNDGKEGFLDAPLANGESVRLHIRVPRDASTGEYVGVWELGTVLEDGSGQLWGEFDFGHIGQITLNEDGTTDAE